MTVRCKRQRDEEQVLMMNRTVLNSPLPLPFGSTPDPANARRNGPMDGRDCGFRSQQQIKISQIESRSHWVAVGLFGRSGGSPVVISKANTCSLIELPPELYGKTPESIW
jgi:hypothetical protein